MAKGFLMNINPQFILGKDGLPSNVVISFEEWQALSEKMPDIVPDWQKAESIRRLAAYHAAPSSAIPFDDFLKALGMEEHDKL